MTKLKAAKELMEEKRESILGDKLTLPWYFDKPIEKILIVISFLCLILTIIRLITKGNLW